MNSADIMASLLIVKAEVEDKLGTTMRMVFAGDPKPTCWRRR